MSIPPFGWNAIHYETYFLIQRLSGRLKMVCAVSYVMLLIILCDCFFLPGTFLTSPSCTESIHCITMYVNVQTVMGFAVNLLASAAVLLHRIM